MGRTILVGDVHGCAGELDRLLDRLAFADGDQLVLVGDLVARGPDSPGVIDVARRVGARAVMGNHEAKLLTWWKARQDDEPPPSLGVSHQAVVRVLEEPHWRWIERLPLWLDLPEHDLRVVHAGVLPGVPIEQQPRWALLKLRSIGPGDTPREGDGPVRWGVRYDERPHVVFGHNAQPVPQLHPHATGIDTGAVYGGHLTALVLGPGERVPPPHERRGLLRSVRAKQIWYDGRKVRLPHP